MEKAYVRNATKNDFNVVKRFANNLHNMCVNFDKDFYKKDEDILTKDEYETLLNTNEHFFTLIYIKERPVGMAHFKIDKLNEKGMCNLKRLHVFDLIIDKKYRRNGFGKRMFDYFETIIKQKKLDIMTVNICNKNEEAIEFYKSQGMQNAFITMIKKYNSKDVV